MNPDTGGGALPEPTDSELADPGLDQLMDRLRGLAPIDGPPALVDELARAAFETRDLDAELAVLTADSAVDRLALVRSAETATAPRMVSFEADSVSIELQLDAEGPTVVIRGLVTGAARGTVFEMETGTGRRALTVDGDGWFFIDGLVAARVRFRINGAGAHVVTTPWLSI